MKKSRKEVLEITRMKKSNYVFKRELSKYNKNLQREAKQIERRNYIGEMAAGMGHEIRNPLTTVRGFLQMLAQKERSPKNLEYYDLMIEELDRVNLIVAEYISLAKDKAIKLEERSLNAIIQSMYTSLDSEIFDKRNFIDLELGDIDSLLLDEQEIRKLITHLVNNGLEAMSNGGQIIIRTLQQKDKIILEVMDQGPGMDDEILEKIGTPFFTTKDNATGLGLAICYSIANRHNAKIKVDTTPDGTSFKVIFH